VGVIILWVAWEAARGAYYSLLGSQMDGTVRTISADRSVYQEGEEIVLTITVASLHDTRRILLPAEPRDYIALQAMQGSNADYCGAEWLPSSHQGVVKVRPDEPWTISLSGKLTKQSDGNGLSLHFAGLGSLSGFREGEVLLWALIMPARQDPLRSETSWATDPITIRLEEAE